MLEQVVVLLGGRDPLVTHDSCEALGADACQFQVRWSTAQ
jgi:predicted hydrocarbon binding protein